MNAVLTPIEKKLQDAGLELVGSCAKLLDRGPQLLRNAALLEDFKPEEVSALGAAMLLVRAQPGQVLISEGETGDWMLLLLSGTVDVTRRGVNGDPSRLAVIRPGAAIGEMSMLDGELRAATCVALDAVEAGVLTRGAIGQLIRDQPAVGAKLLVKLTQLLAQRLRNTSNQLIKALQKPA